LSTFDGANEKTLDQRPPIRYLFDCKREFLGPVRFLGGRVFSFQAAVAAV
jgi:hypothetical protein